MSIERKQYEIDEQIDKAIQDNGKYPGMSYEDGVRAALEWVTGDSDDLPMEDE